jgi:hypothetical protein
MLRSLELSDRPRLARHVSWRTDLYSGDRLLIAHERGLRLNASALAVVQACSGERSVAQILEDSMVSANKPGGLPADVLSLLQELWLRGLLQVPTAPA